MKKLVSLILISVMFLAVTVMPTFAEATEPEYIYKDKFIEYISPFDLGMYDECYYHTDENGNVDWAIIEASTSPADPVIGRALICDKVIEADCYYTPLIIRYGLYDAKADEFLSFQDLDVTKYDGLEEYIKANIKGRIVGDADGDNELTILDATFIQRAVADLCKFAIDDYFGDYNPNFPIDYISDFDRDGERTILDATAIQLKLAEAK